MNDKCSASTGKFLEISAGRLGLELNEIYKTARKNPAIKLSSTCTVFAESEIVSLSANRRRSSRKYRRALPQNPLLGNVSKRRQRRYYQGIYPRVSSPRRHRRRGLPHLRDPDEQDQRGEPRSGSELYEPGDGLLQAGRWANSHASRSVYRTALSGSLEILK